MTSPNAHWLSMAMSRCDLILSLDSCDQQICTRMTTMDVQGELSWGVDEIPPKTKANLCFSEQFPLGSRLASRGRRQKSAPTFRPNLIIPKCLRGQNRAQNADFLLIFADFLQDSRLFLKTKKREMQIFAEKPMIITGKRKKPQENLQKNRRLGFVHLGLSPQARPSLIIPKWGRWIHISPANRWPLIRCGFCCFFFPHQRAELTKKRGV